MRYLWEVDPESSSPRSSLQITNSLQPSEQFSQFTLHVTAMSSERMCKKAISGFGQSDIQRKPIALPFELAVRACEQAIGDAGLRPEHIDGAACWPPVPAGAVTGAGAAGIADITSSLRASIEPKLYSRLASRLQIRDRQTENQSRN
ncbi:MAG: hypothetical protein ABIM50_11510 [Novosphingobium sp.]